MNHGENMESNIDYHIQDEAERLLKEIELMVVIYALGSMEYSLRSQFQLAIVLLLKLDFSNWIGDIQVYDPGMSPADIIVFKELGFEVLTIDENCKRQVRRPTMFYMPHPNYYHIGNLVKLSSRSSNRIFSIDKLVSPFIDEIRPFTFNPERSNLNGENLLGISLTWIPTLT
ncbi:protein SENSITIVITY TO RED LIGHT REDUCED 1-like [Lycium ferocissimum]|uniref:protein SENSITIVITY TO RED LIGHT REDUCED 1-like n=1 Tax=Lycium ferocissimum TaxID=112874 RepID=UPI002815DC3F|nr:protein SENSITIVITY TO RED LIGHT REDUCED 1-like [Lycium ferocissimum]